MRHHARSRSCPRSAIERWSRYVPVTVDLERCVGSRDCLGACAFNAIEVQNGKAVIFENCVDCDACVRACPTNAIISSTAPVAAAGSTLIVDFSERSGIVAGAERAVKRASLAALGVRVDPSDAGAAADALSAYAKESSSTLIILPHAAAGPAIAARLASLLGASLLAGCNDLLLDDAGGVRATRLRYGGIVKVQSRTGAGTTVVTLAPRGPMPFAAQQIESAGAHESAGEAPEEPLRRARSAIVIGEGLSSDAIAAAHAAARSLGAPVIEIKDLQAANLAPELLIAIGVDGSTELNSAMRSAGTIVALIEQPAAPIAQIADYLLVGDVAEHAKALCAAV